MKKKKKKKIYFVFFFFRRPYGEPAGPAGGHGARAFDLCRTLYTSIVTRAFSDGISRRRPSRARSLAKIYRAEKFVPAGTVRR